MCTHSSFQQGKIPWLLYRFTYETQDRKSLTSNPLQPHLNAFNRTHIPLVRYLNILTGYKLKSYEKGNSFIVYHGCPAPLQLWSGRTGTWQEKRTL